MAGIPAIPPRQQLELPAERAQEADEGADTDRAVPEHHPATVPGRARREMARDGQIGHGSRREIIAC